MATSWTVYSSGSGAGAGAKKAAFGAGASFKANCVYTVEVHLEKQLRIPFGFTKDRTPGNFEDNISGGVYDTRRSSIK
jgi:hypothetical protein